MSAAQDWVGRSTTSSGEVIVCDGCETVIPVVEQGMVHDAPVEAYGADVVYIVCSPKCLNRAMLDEQVHQVVGCSDPGCLVHPSTDPGVEL